MKSFRKHQNSHAREIALQALYQTEVGGQPIAEILEFKWLNEPFSGEEAALATELVGGVIDHGGALDGVISGYSSVDFSQISSIVRLILKMGVYEMRLSGRDPAIVMDDLLNLTRRYEGDQAVAFVNAILDHYKRDMQEAVIKKMTEQK